MKVVSLRADAVEGFFTPKVAGDVLNGQLAHVHPTVGGGAVHVGDELTVFRPAERRILRQGLLLEDVQGTPDALLAELADRGGGVDDGSPGRVHQHAPVLQVGQNLTVDDVVVGGDCNAPQKLDRYDENACAPRENGAVKGAAEGEGGAQDAARMSPVR
jgi:hypothetical protein